MITAGFKKLDEKKAERYPAFSLVSNIGPFRAWKLTILVLNGIRLLAPVSLGKLSTNESAVMSDLDQ